MNDIPRVPGEERVFAASLGLSERKMKLRPEQKSVEWMMDALCKIGEPRELVMDTSSSTFATAKACMTLSSNCEFVASEKDSECSEAVFRSLI